MLNLNSTVVFLINHPSRYLRWRNVGGYCWGVFLGCFFFEGVYVCACVCVVLLLYFLSVVVLVAVGRLHVSLSPLAPVNDT